MCVFIELVNIGGLPLKALGGKNVTGLSVVNSSGYK